MLDLQSTVREDERQAARVGLAKVLANRLFNEWLAEQAAAGTIPADAAQAQAEASGEA